MSKLAPTVIQARLLHIIHRAFVQVRNLALKGDCQQLYDLADTFEVVPELMASWDETTLGRIRGILAEYDSDHPQSGYEYQSLLDADETAFLANGFNVVVGNREEMESSE